MYATCNTQSLTLNFEQQPFASFSPTLTRTINLGKKELLDKEIPSQHLSLPWGCNAMWRWCANTWVRGDWLFITIGANSILLGFVNQGSENWRQLLHFVSIKAHPLSADSSAAAIVLCFAANITTPQMTIIIRGITRTLIICNSSLIPTTTNTVVCPSPKSDIHFNGFSWQNQSCYFRNQ